MEKSWYLIIIPIKSNLKKNNQFDIQFTQRFKIKIRYCSSMKQNDLNPLAFSTLHFYYLMSQQKQQSFKNTRHYQFIQYILSQPFTKRLPRKNSLTIVHDILNNFVQAEFNQSKPKKIKKQKPADGACVICLGNQQVNCKTDCDHQFCYKCIRGWLQKQKNCPICRVQLRSLLLKGSLEEKVKQYEKQFKGKWLRIGNQYLQILPTLKKRQQQDLDDSSISDSQSDFIVDDDQQEQVQIMPMFRCSKCANLDQQYELFTCQWCQAKRFHPQCQPQARGCTQWLCGDCKLVYIQAMA